MQVGLDYQNNLNSTRAQNVFGNAFTLPKIGEATKVLPPQKQSEQIKTEQKPDLFETVAEQTTNTQPQNEVETVTPKASKTFKEKIAGAWKFLASADQMVGATIRGLIYGAITGIALLSGSWLFKSLPNAFAKEGPGLWNTIRHPLKNISKSGKIIAGIGSAIVLGINMIKGKLDTNQRTAVIDHKMKTGHREVK